MVHHESHDLVKLFSSFSETPFTCCLLGKDPYGVEDAKVVAIGAFHNKQPIGLVTASIHPVMHLVQIHSLFVDPIHRNKSLAHQLLAKLETVLTSGVQHQLLLVYALDNYSTPALEKILNDLQWNGKQPFMTRCKFNALLFDPPWLNQPFAYPEGMQQFFWKDLSPKDLEDLYFQERQSIFTSALSPFRDQEILEPLNSLGLRHRENIIGWCLTHRTASDTIRYSNFYINKNFRRGKYNMQLLIHAIQLQKKAAVKWAITEIPLLLVNAAWTHLVEKRLVPYAESVTRLVQAWKKVLPR